MKRILLITAMLSLLLSCSIKVTKPMLKMILSATDKISTESAYADTCEHLTGVPYIAGGSGDQVVDIYYADPAVRKDAVLIDIHGGFYVAGRRQNNRKYASVFLKEGYDVILVEYRRNDGKLDVADELGDCAAALDYIATNSADLRLNKDRMFLTGDSAGGHLALYMAEGAEDVSLPIRPKSFVPRGVLLSCPAYDFATFSNTERFSKGALEWFIGPRYQNKDWMTSVSPRTFIGSYTGPLLVSTCTNDFIRQQSLIIKADCDSLGRDLVFVDIESADKKVAHVHNVIDPALPESQTVNGKMIEFMNGLL